MPAISRILCPVDLSETSRHGVEQAVVIAGWYRARLTALHVYSPIFAPVPALPAPADRVPAFELQRVREETTAMCQTATSAGLGLDVVVDVGQPAASILDCAATSRADLIVMGTHGKSGFEHFVLGSVTEKVLRKAACPVLTVPPRSHMTSRFPFERVLCAVDFSEWSVAAVNLAASMAQESGAVLDLLHVLEWPWEEPPPPAFAELPLEQGTALMEFRRYLVKSATNRLESLARDDIGDRCRVTLRIAHGKPYRQILRVAEEAGADLIVLGVHGRNAVDLALFGSTTNHLVRLATCPVLTVRR